MQSAKLNADSVVVAEDSQLAVHLDDLGNHALSFGFLEVIHFNVSFVVVGL